MKSSPYARLHFRLMHDILEVSQNSSLPDVYPEQPVDAPIVTPFFVPSSPMKKVVDAAAWMGMVYFLETGMEKRT